MTQSAKIYFLCLLLVGGLLASINTAGAAYQVTIENRTYSPALVIDPRTWLVKIVTITRLPKSPGLVMHIPCLTSDSSAGELHKPGVISQSYKDYWCVPQVIPTGFYKGVFVDQNGQIMAKPPQ
jgi:hypothetical protein